MASSPARRPRKKEPGRYHHGDLRRALVDQALRTIDRHGVEALTLREVGQALGVSRTALYRHFSDKQALLAAVSREGFRTLRLALLDTWERAEGGQDGFAAMGEAYLRFAMEHPAHYRVMFGRFREACALDAELTAEAEGAFRALVDALVALQREHLVRDDDPMLMARFVWSITHGIAMLVIDGQLGPIDSSDSASAALNRYALERVRVALAPGTNAAQAPEPTAR